ncbi:MAG: VanZ family protein [Gemmataceae bacterium]|nr:VanZ family protein [Gemmata sp.]MDW8198077.1 VanZ family protein [Gemmataceae bacterium]
MNATRRAYGWATVGVAAFLVYGSLVPFEFHPRPLGRAADDFGNILKAGVVIPSRSDAVANVLLGIPIGFALLGWIAAERGWSRWRMAGVGVLAWPACVTFSAAVEFAQLFTAGRTCAVSDILAQALGACIGIGAWVAIGPAFTANVRTLANRTDLNAAGRISLVYIALVAFLQTLPFDATASPANLYRKLRDDVHFRPFSEYEGRTAAERWQHTGQLAKLAGLFFPLGLLAAHSRGRFQRWKLPRVALAALGLAVALESLQLVIQSRVPSTTDALVGASAIVVGWYAARVHAEGLARPLAVSWFLIWLALMTPITQPPAEAPRRPTPRAFDWLPGLPLTDGHPLWAFEEMLTKLVLFGLLGVLVAAAWLPPRTRRGPRGSVRTAAIIAGIAAVVIAAAIENRQRWFETHTPCMTDVLLGGLGAVMGVVVASWIYRPSPASQRLVC